MREREGGREGKGKGKRKGREQKRKRENTFNGVTVCEYSYNI